jgi:hypothetical protein
VTKLVQSVFCAIHLVDSANVSHTLLEDDVMNVCQALSDLDLRDAHVMFFNLNLIVSNESNL